METLIELKFINSLFSNSDFSIQVVRAHPLIEIRQTIIEQFEATVSQSSVPSPPLKQGFSSLSAECGQAYSACNTRDGDGQTPPHTPRLPSGKGGTAALPPSIPLSLSLPPFPCLSLYFSLSLFISPFIWQCSAFVPLCPSVVLVTLSISPYLPLRLSLSLCTSLSLSLAPPCRL